MNFWIIHAQENPAEARSQRFRKCWRSNSLAEQLADSGHSVIRWRSAFSHNKKEFFPVQNVPIKYDNYQELYLSTSPYTHHVGIKRVLSHKNLALSFRLVSSMLPQPDLIHVSSVPVELFVAVVDYATRNQIKVVVDIRDLWPDSYFDLLPSFLNFAKPFLLRFYKYFCFDLKRSFQHCNAITAISPAFIDWVSDFLPKRLYIPSKFFPLCYPSPVVPSNSSLDQFYCQYNLLPSHFIATYPGILGFQSNFSSIIESGKLIYEHLPSFRLVLAGFGPQFSQLKGLSEDFDFLIVPGWLNSSDLNCLLTVTSLGILAYKPSNSFTNTISNKFSEMLAYGLPIACGLPGIMSNYINDFECGFNYNPHSPADLYEKVLSLHHDSDLLSTYSKNSVKLHDLQFKHEVITPLFSDHLISML